MVSDCLNHHLTTGLAAWVAVGLELVAELVGFGGEQLDVAWKTPKGLLHLRLVRLPWMEAVMALQLLSQGVS